MIKRYWPYLLIVLLLIIICWQQNCINNIADEKLAGIAREKIMQRETVKQKAIADNYIIKNKKADEDIVAKDKIIKDLNVLKNVWHKSSVIAETEVMKRKTCPEQLTGMTNLFHGAQKFILDFSTVSFKAVDDLNFAWQSKIKIKDSEIREVNASWSDVTAKLGDCTKELVIAKLKAKRITNLGFFAGYDFLNKRFAAGLGFTIDIIRLPKLFGGIL